MQRHMQCTASAMDAQRLAKYRGQGRLNQRLGGYPFLFRLTQSVRFHGRCFCKAQLWASWFRFHVYSLLRKLAGQ